MWLPPADVSTASSPKPSVQLSMQQDSELSSSSQGPTHRLVQRHSYKWQRLDLPGDLLNHRMF